jgi:2-keto-3-deoxy-L-rhamnonate aldolase RhmA
MNPTCQYVAVGVGDDIVGKIATANSETHLIAQIETAAGVENANAIAAVDGIDVL